MKIILICEVTDNEETSQQWYKDLNSASNEKQRTDVEDEQ